MEKKLSFFQNFNAMRIFLSMYFNQTRSADIGIILSSLRLFKDRLDWKENLSTWDPAAFQDWMNGVNKTLQDLDIKQDPRNIEYDQVTAFLCMKNFLLLFYKEIPYEDIGTILHMLNIAKYTKKNIVWSQWLLAIHHSINKTYPLDKPLESV